MELRPELTPPPVDPARIAELSAEIERIERLLTTDAAAADEAIARFNESTGSGYEHWDFASFQSWRTAEEWALAAARPACRAVDDVTRDELVEVVRRSRLTDADADYYASVFTVNASSLRLRLDAVHRRGERDPVNEPRTDPPTDPAAELSPEQEVDAVLRYRPIAL